MEFESDPRKNQSNREKHGIDFLAAQTIWEDHALLEFPARKHWSAVITLRGPAIRLISVRRSRPDEVQLYEQL